MKGETRYYTFDTETGEIVSKCDDVLLIKKGDVLEGLKEYLVVKVGWINFRLIPGGYLDWYTDTNHSTKKRKDVIIGSWKSLKERDKSSIEDFEICSIITQSGI